MNAEILAEWLRQQGHHVIRTESSYWYDQGPRVYQAFPYHWQIRPTQAELNQLLVQHRAIGLRYSAPLSALTGAVSYHVIYDGPEYELANLPKKARYDVRTGLKNVDVVPISFERLAREGWILRLDTLRRQDRVGGESEQWWKRLCLATKNLPGFEAWGAMVEDQLVASLLAFSCDDCCLILYQESLSEHLCKGINNALTYVFTHEVINRPAIARVFYGLHSLDAPATVDQYKFRMNFVAKPVRQRVVFHPWLAPLFNPATHALIRQVQRRWPGNPTLAKTEGMVRFYLEGQRPLREQTWPECLGDYYASMFPSTGPTPAKLESIPSPGPFASAGEAPDSPWR
jgi:hypothetical protein